MYDAASNDRWCHSSSYRDGIEHHLPCFQGICRCYEMAIEVSVAIGLCDYE